jgi:hypothetical protein
MEKEKGDSEDQKPPVNPKDLSDPMEMAKMAGENQVFGDVVFAMLARLSAEENRKGMPLSPKEQEQIAMEVMDMAKSKEGRAVLRTIGRRFEEKKEK